VIGIEADLDGMDTGDCESFYKSFYSPNNAVICVTGAWKPERVAATIWKHYGKIANHPRPANAVTAEPAQKDERVSVLSLPIQVEKAYLGYKIPDAKAADQVPLHVLTYILSSGRSSRLYRNLVDAGICMDQGASTHASKDPALLYMSFTCQSGRRADEALSVLDRELRLVAEKGVRDDELERVKNRLRTEIHLGLASNSAMARFIGQHEVVMGDVRLGLEEIEHIQAVDVAEIQAVARKYLVSGNRSVVVGKPQ
jgi:predicted Zn-dependent peptidase